MLVLLTRLNSVSYRTPYKGHPTYVTHTHLELSQPRHCPGGVRPDSQLLHEQRQLSFSGRAEPTVKLQPPNPDRWLDRCAFDYPRLRRQYCKYKAYLRPTSYPTLPGASPGPQHYRHPAMYALASLLAALALLATSADCKAKPRDAILLSQVSPQDLAAAASPAALHMRGRQVIARWPTGWTNYSHLAPSRSSHSPSARTGRPTTAASPPSRSSSACPQGASAQSTRSTSCAARTRAPATTARTSSGAAPPHYRRS